MKIAFFSYPFGYAEPPKIGSLAIIAYQLGLRLAAANNEVLFYGSKVPHSLELEYSEDGITYRGIPEFCPDKIISTILEKLDEWKISHSLRPFCHSILYYFGFYWQVARNLKAKKCEIVHIIAVSQTVSLVRFFNPQAKIVLHAQTEWLSYYDQAMMEKQVNQADLVIGCSNYVTDRIRIDQGKYLSQLKNIISPTAANSVSFLGAVNYQDLIKYYQETDIFIFPSVWNEPFGMPIVEAMSVELPVIATDGGAFPELVDEGKTGLLVERGNSHALAEAILCLLKDENLCQEMGKAGRQKVVENFTWERISEKLFKLYQDL